MKALKQSIVTLGCDPEFFFEKGGKIIGSEKVIDIEKGLTVDTYDGTKGSSGNKYMPSKFICDGVQAELNPKPATCRENLANELSFCFRELYKKTQEDPDLKINFGRTVKITKGELKQLDKKSRVFGCAPSMSTTKKAKPSKIKIDASKYMYRSAGGHIHLGLCKVDESGVTPDGRYITFPAPQTAFEHPARLVNVLDILVGNTCVLLDRDEGNKIRRQVYGKAGEYRVPAHGVEYRTLSNFWLRSYPLFDMVFGLSRIAVSIMNRTTETDNYEAELLKLVKMKDIHKAINNNDFDLAYANFQKIKPYICACLPDDKAGGQYIATLNATNLDLFEHFIKKGVDHWFKDDVLTHWVKLPNASRNGFETFLRTHVKEDMEKEKQTL